MSEPPQDQSHGHEHADPVEPAREHTHDDGAAHTHEHEDAGARSQEHSDHEHGGGKRPGFLARLFGAR